MSNILLLLGLLASVGSPVDARFYRGGAQDYSDHAFASTKQFFGYSQAQVSTGGYSDVETTYDYTRTYSDNTPRTYTEGSPSTFIESTPWSTDAEGTPSLYVGQTPSSLDWDVQERFVLFASCFSRTFLAFSIHCYSPSCMSNLHGCEFISYVVLLIEVLECP